MVKRSVVRSSARSSNISKKTQTKGWPTDIHVHIHATQMKTSTLKLCGV